MKACFICLYLFISIQKSIKNTVNLIMSISKINDAFFLLNIQCIKHQPKKKKKNNHEKMIKEFVKRLKSQSCLGVTKGYADSIFFSFFSQFFFK